MLPWPRTKTQPQWIQCHERGASAGIVSPIIVLAADVPRESGLGPIVQVRCLHPDAKAGTPQVEHLSCLVSEKHIATGVDAHQVTYTLPPKPRDIVLRIPPPIIGMRRVRFAVAEKEPRAWT